MPDRASKAAGSPRAQAATRSPRAQAAGSPRAQAAARPGRDPAEAGARALRPRRTPAASSATAPAATLRALERIAREYGAGLAAQKLPLLARLERVSLARAGDVLRLHDVLCFLRAYPDDRAVLDRVERMLAAFAQRADLRRQSQALGDSGVAGTAIHFRFFSPTAQWLARRWPERLTVDWKAFENDGDLGDLLPLLAHPSEQPGLDEFEFEVRDWVGRLKGPHETDAAFLLRRFAALRMDELARETLYDKLDPPLVLEPGPGTPARTHARVATAAAGAPPPALAPGEVAPERIAFQKLPLSRTRPALRDELARPPIAVREVDEREGEALIDLARAAMVTRARDLDAFSWGDAHDVRMIGCGEGLEFAMIGMIPERRLLLESVYGFLTLKNGVPIGYVLTGSLFGSCEVAYNVFETYRGAEAGPVYGRVLATSAHLFGADCFMVPPYQLGHDNDEAIDSGAWWFYQKLGFRPRDRNVLALMRAEERRFQATPRARSTQATLRRLAAQPVFFHAGRDRDDVLGVLALPAVGLRITDFLARRFGADRERGERECAAEAERLLGAGPGSDWTEGERSAWGRWAPLVCILPGLAEWSAAERRALAEVVRAKGARRESEFVTRFDRHAKLRSAIQALAASGTRRSDGSDRPASRDES